MNLSLQITEAEKHAGEMRQAAEKGGKAQSAAQIRADAATAMLTTLKWLRENESDFRQWAAEKRAAQAQRKDEGNG